MNRAPVGLRESQITQQKTNYTNWQFIKKRYIIKR